MRKFADRYNLGNVPQKSPLRNVLNVATESGSGIEITKNYILYQLGRKGSNPMWKYKGSKGDKASKKESFAVALVQEIEALAQNAEYLVQSICEDPTTEDIQSVHVRLMQLYLGNLARYQAFLAYKGSNN